MPNEKNPPPTPSRLHGLLVGLGDHHRQVATDGEDVGVHHRGDGRALLLELLVVAVDALLQRTGAGVGETQCADGLLGRHLHRRRPGAGHPDRRVRPLQRLGDDVAGRHLDVLALEAGERLLGHAADGDLECLFPLAALVGRVDVEPAELADRRRLTGAELDAAVGDQVERRDALGDAGRMVDGGRQVHDAEAEPNVLGALARCGQEHLRRGRVTVLLEEVVLGQPDRREAGLVGQLDLVEAVLEQLVLVVVGPRPRQGELVEQRNLHRLPPVVLSVGSSESAVGLVVRVWAMCLAAT